MHDIKASKIAIKQAPYYIRDRREFWCSNMEFKGEWDNHTYLVYSHGTCIAEYNVDFRKGVWVINDTLYNTAISRHQGYVKKAFTHSAWVDSSIHLIKLKERVEDLQPHILGKTAIRRLNRITYGLDSVWR